jgi:hypothetical protein
MSGTIVSHNAAQAIKYCQNKRVMRYLLRMSGIPVGAAQPEAMHGLRVYRVQVYHHHILSIEMNPQRSPWLLHPLPVQQSANSVPIDTDDQEVKLVTHLAVRSVYAVGLVCGQVTVAAHSPTRARVMEIDPHITEGEMDLSRLAEIRAQAEQAGTVDVMLGADPEFALRSPDGGMVLASDFLGKHGTVGCDSTRYREELGMNQWPLVELRPRPSRDPDELFSLIYQALQVARRKIANEAIDWLAGGMPFDGYPIGGHVHFSGIAPSFPLLRKLDAYLSLPLLLVEDEGCRKRRPRYGFLGDFREKSHGGFEYRTLPSWLVTPMVTRGVLHLAKLVSTHHTRLSAQPYLQLPLIRAYYTGDKERLKPVVRAMWQELSSLTAYHASRRQLDAFFTYVLSGETWPADRDIRKAWKLHRNRAIMNK